MRMHAHDVSQRIGSVERPEELADVAHDPDGLLDRLAAAVRHEQMAIVVPGWACCSPGVSRVRQVATSRA
jgi:hypothetical protein